MGAIGFASVKYVKVLRLKLVLDKITLVILQGPLNENVKYEILLNIFF